jgi:ATP-dependent RNA helicase DOB1
MQKIISLPEHILPFLVPGRMVRVRNSGVDWGWGIVVTYTKQRFAARQEQLNQKTMQETHSNHDDDIFDCETHTVENYVVDTLLYVNTKIDFSKKYDKQNQKNIKNHNKGKDMGQLQPGNVGLKNGFLGIVPIMLKMIQDVSSVQMKMMKDIKKQDNINHLQKLYFELMNRFNFELPLLDAVKDLEITDSKFMQIKTRKDKLESQLDSFKEYDPNQLLLCEKKKTLKTDIKFLKTALNKTKSLVLKDDLKNMSRTLRRLQFCDKEMILTKGLHFLFFNF